jgi:hypothetical protein
MLFEGWLCHISTRLRQKKSSSHVNSSMHASVLPYEQSPSLSGWELQFSVLGICFPAKLACFYQIVACLSCLCFAGRRTARNVLQQRAGIVLRQFQRPIGRSCVLCLEVTCKKFPHGSPGSPGYWSRLGVCECLRDCTRGQWI